jgi:hypothetical protein
MPIDFAKYDQNEWLKGGDLEEGERLVVTIKNVYEHTFEQSGDQTVFVEFVELEKKLSLNKTRRNKLIDLLGDDSDEWFGCQVALYPVPVNYNGKTVSSVAITNVPRKKAQRAASDDVDGDVVFEKGRN